MRDTDSRLPIPPNSVSDMNELYLNVWIEFVVDGDGDIVDCCVSCIRLFGISKSFSVFYTCNATLAK